MCASTHVVRQDVLYGLDNVVYVHKFRGYACLRVYEELRFRNGIIHAHGLEPSLLDGMLAQKLQGDGNLNPIPLQISLFPYHDRLDE